MFEAVTVHKKKGSCGPRIEHDGEQYYQENIERLINSIHKKE